MVRLVKPFYLQMMGLNALSAEPSLIADVGRAAAKAKVDDVIALLRDTWRPEVVGAWFSVVKESDEINATVLDALSKSYGSLTAPPLAVAAMTLVGGEALPALSTYLERDLAASYGSAGFIAASIEHLGAEPSVQAEPDDRDNVAGMLTIAAQLRSTR